MRKLKYDYEDVNRKVVLLNDVDDIQPYNILLPEAPKPELIGNFGLPKEQQFFQREKIPRKIWELTHEVNKGKLTRKEAFTYAQRDAELSSFIQAQWRKREHGDWQYINGKPYYFTGTYWFFLNYYLLDVGLPSFREQQYNQSLWWKFCVEDNESVYGGINFTRRREGKTYWGGNILLEYTTRTERAISGIQSKSETDAGILLRKAVVYQFKRLPFFFKPEYEGTKMINEIDLSCEDVETSFESKIDFRSTTPTAYDGQKLGRWLGDEFGKMIKPADPIEIWDKNKLCFWVEGKIIGKALITTTVEEMTKGGGEEFKHLFHHSSLIPKDNMINEFGETETGLIPYFTPAYKNMFHDQYGMSIIDNPKPYQAEWRKKQGDKFWNIGGREYVDKQIESSKDAKSKQDTIRKMPRTIKEAFRYNNTGCLFDIDIINKRLEYFNNGYPREYEMTFGYFDWVPGKEFKEATFIPTSEKQARCHVRYMPAPNLRNKFYIKNGKQCPSNIMRFNAGADPFKLKTEQIKNKDKMSMGGIHVFALYDPSVDEIGKPREEWRTDNFALEYIFRPDTPDQFCEDVAKICVFYGCKVFPEFNIQIVDTYFRDNGLEEYLQFRYKNVQRGNVIIQKEDKKVAGAYTNESFLPVLIRWGINYVREKGAYCPFPRTLEQLRDLQYETLNEHDAAASAMYCLVGTFDQPKKEKPKSKLDLGKDIGIPELRSYGRVA